MLRRFSWIIDRRVEVAREESLQLEELMNRRRRGEVGSGALIEADDSSIRRQGLKYDCRIIKSREGGGRGCFVRIRNDLFFPVALDCPITISALRERLCRLQLGVLRIVGESE